MNLAEFIRKNDIKCEDGEELDHSLEFFKYSPAYGPRWHGHTSGSPL